MRSVPFSEVRVIPFKLHARAMGDYGSIPRACIACLQMGHVDKPEEIAALPVCLASDARSFTIGQT